MAIFRNDPVSKLVNDKQRSPAAWIMGLTFLLALLGVIFLYDGRDSSTAPGPNTPNVVNNPTGSK